jgi:uncharacterized protein YggE
MYARLAALAAALSLILAPAALADATTPSTLSVDGSGLALVTPDVATLSLSVARSAATSRSALSAANRRTNLVVAALRAAGVSAAAVQTNSIDVARGSVRVGPRKRRVTRFTATESLTARITDIRSVGRVLDAAIGAGADSIDGPSFSFSDPSAGKVQATRAALADARRRADDAAAALGYRVTGVQSVDLDPQPTPITTAGGTGSAPTATARPTTPTNVRPGAEEVDASVHVVYTIAPM